MKTSFALLFVALIGLAAFLVGRGKPGEPAEQAAAEMAAPGSPAKPPARPMPDARVKVKPRVGTDVLTPEKAARLASGERIELLKKAALLADPEKQADILCGLISVMNQDELTETAKVLLDAQRRGNNWSQEVWNTLWTQWGRVNAEACLALSKTGEHYPGWNGLNGLNTPNDYRCLMAGWLETKPEAAIAWARETKDDYREATAAAFAVTSSANGDLKQMAAAILAVSGDKLTTKACFQDYFDLATTASSGDKQSLSTAYDQLDPVLRAAAWPAVVERLGYSDSETAGSWLKQHLNDPGYNEQAIGNLIGQLAGKDPAGTAKWAVELPEATGQSDGPHPAALVVRRWLMEDPQAAHDWLLTQPAGAPWVTPFQAGQEAER